MRRFRALRPQAEIVHIAKLGVPHFDEARFNTQRTSALQFPLLHPAVTSVMISVSSIEHAEAAVAAVEKVVSSKFKSIVKKILAIAQNKKSLS